LFDEAQLKRYLHDLNAPMPSLYKQNILSITKHKHGHNILLKLPKKCYYAGMSNDEWDEWLDNLDE